MNLTGEVSYTDVVQTILAVLAFFALPQVVGRAYNRLRYTFVAKLTPVDVGEGGFTDTWQIAIQNRARTSAAGIECTIIPIVPGANIAFAVLQSEADGGLHVGERHLEHGAFKLSLGLVAPGREARVAIRMTLPGIPFVHSPDRALRQIVLSAPFSPQLMHLRLMVLLLHFMAAAAIIVVRLLMLGLTR